MATEWANRLSDCSQVGLLHAHTGTARAGLPPLLLLLMLLLLGLMPDMKPNVPKAKLPKAGATLVEVPFVTQPGKLASMC